MVAVTPMYYTRCFSKYLGRDDLIAIELQDTPREIKKDITYYKGPFSRIRNKFQMNNDPPEKVVLRLIEQFDFREAD